MDNKWINEYKGLTKYKKNKLYSVIGPFVMGIELIKLPRIDKYRPHFVIYSLYGLPTGNTLKDCMSYPILMLEWFNPKGLQYSLDFEEDVTEVIQSLNEFLTFELGEDVVFELILKWLDQIQENPKYKFLIKLSNLLQIRYNLALYYSNERAKLILKEIENSAGKFNNERVFKKYGGFSKWFQELASRDRGEQLKLIEKNKNSKELKKLNFFEII